jgi:serine/threonine protein kinase
MGEVYRARDTRLERNVATKILPTHLADDPSLKQRLEREAKAVSKLSHPNICTLHDIGQHELISYLVMELVEGETLEQRLTRGALPCEQILRYGSQIADALAKARHIVKLSAMGEREAIFPRQHAESEDYIKSSGVPYTFLRPNGFMQNFVTYNSATINTQNALYGVQGDGTVSHIDIRDIAAVAVKVLTEDGYETKHTRLRVQRRSVMRAVQKSFLKTSAARFVMWT